MNASVTKHGWTAIGLIAWITAIGFAQEKPARENTPQPASRPAIQPAGNKVPPFVADTISGSQVVFPPDYRGKIVLVTFWATWCPKCKTEIPYWRSAYDNFHDQGLEILGIPTDKNRNTAQAVVAKFAADNGLVWPQIFQDAPDLSTLYEVTSVPTLWLIDGDTGAILADRGALRRDQLGITIEQQLKLKGLWKHPPSSKPAVKTISPPARAASQPASRPATRPATAPASKPAPR